MAKETCIYGKRDMYTWQKRRVYMAKETCIYSKRDVYIWQKRHVYMAKETFIYGKRRTLSDGVAAKSRAPLSPPLTHGTALLGAPV